MKLIIQSIIGSIVFHLLYLVGTIGIGYINTIFYTPNIEDTRNMTYLQNEVAFGFVKTMPYYVYFISFIFAALMTALLITMFKQVKVKTS